MNRGRAKSDYAGAWMGFAGDFLTASSCESHSKCEAEKKEEKKKSMDNEKLQVKQQRRREKEKGETRN